MKYQEKLNEAEQLETQGKNFEAAKIFEEIGTKCLRESGKERREAPKIIARSIARYLLANNQAKAKDLAYQVMFMKDEHPFLSLQIESAISSKTHIIRAYEVSKLPTKIDSSYSVLNDIPRNRKVLKYESEVTIKNLWELNPFGQYVKKYDLVDQKYSNPQDLVNYILATKTGIWIIAAEDTSNKQFVIVISVTFNKNPVEVVHLKA